MYTLYTRQNASKLRTAAFQKGSCGDREVHSSLSQGDALQKYLEKKTEADAAAQQRHCACRGLAVAVTGTGSCSALADSSWVTVSVVYATIPVVA